MYSQSSHQEMVYGLHGRTGLLLTAFVMHNKRNEFGRECGDWLPVPIPCCSPKSHLVDIPCEMMLAPRGGKWKISLPVPILLYEGVAIAININNRPFDHIGSADYWLALLLSEPDMLVTILYADDKKR
jgi:hypothetical protein